MAPIQRSLIFFQQAVLKQLWQHLHAFFLSCCHFWDKKSDPGIINLPGNTNRQFSLFFPDSEDQLDASHTLVRSRWSRWHSRRRAACLQLSDPFHCDITKEKKGHVLVSTSSSGCKPYPCLMPEMSILPGESRTSQGDSGVTSQHFFQRYPQEGSLYLYISVHLYISTATAMNPMCFKLLQQQ